MISTSALLRNRDLIEKVNLVHQKKEKNGVVETSFFSLI
jgi:hypothetical protein